MKDEHIPVIDWLRAIAITIVMVTHVLSVNLGPNTINSVWNYLHFVVPVLVFASGYLMYRKYGSRPIAPIGAWYAKRSIRLILPYYGFVLLHYILWMLLPRLFSGYGLAAYTPFIVSTLLFVGVDFGWLVLLFLELMTLTPLYLPLLRSRIRLLLALTVSGLSAVLLLATRIPIDYRFFMWIPWSFPYLLGFAAAKTGLLEKRQARPVLILAGISGVLYLLSTIAAHGLERPLTLSLHKYPPDLLYLSYSFFMGSTILLMLNRVKRMPKIVSWLSSRSYDLFFGHYIAIDLLLAFRAILPLTVVFQIMFVLMTSILLLIALQTIRKYYLRASRAD